MWESISDQEEFSLQVLLVFHSSHGCSKRRFVILHGFQGARVPRPEEEDNCSPSHCVMGQEVQVLTWPVLCRESLPLSRMCCPSGRLPTWTETMVCFVTADGISWFMLSEHIHQVDLYLETRRRRALPPCAAQVQIKLCRHVNLFVWWNGGIILRLVEPWGSWLL